MERNRPACRNDTTTRVRLLVLALGASMCFLTAQAAAPKNNILLLIADDYGADSSSLFNPTNTQIADTGLYALFATNRVGSINTTPVPLVVVEGVD